MSDQRSLEWVVRSSMLIELLRTMHEKVVQHDSLGDNDRASGRSGDYNDGIAEGYRQSFDIVRRKI